MFDEKAKQLERAQKSTKGDQRSRKCEQWERPWELAYLIEGKGNLRGNLTRLSSFIRGCQEEKILSGSPFPPETGKKSAELRLKPGATRENFPAVGTVKPWSFCLGELWNLHHLKFLRAGYRTVCWERARGQGKRSLEWPPSLQASNFC